MTKAIVLGSIAAIFGTIVVAVAIGIFGFLGFQNVANGFENGIVAQYTQNQNNYDNGYKKVLEMASVSEVYAEDFKEVYGGMMSGRYGADGSKAVMQWITEQNPTLDASIYRQIQQAIEIFRNGFQQEQRQLISRKQEYQNFLTTNTSSRFYNWISGGSYPKIDLTKYDIVTSGRTEEAFRTKKDEPLNLRNTK